MTTIPGLETGTGPSSETLKTSKPGPGVREVDQSVEESQALEPRYALPDLTLGVLSFVMQTTNRALGIPNQSIGNYNSHPDPSQKPMLDSPA